MIESSAYKIMFLAQLVYLISISRFFVKYFSHVDHGGLVMQGFLTQHLTKHRVSFIFASWNIALIFNIFFSGATVIISNLICFFFSRYFFIYLRYRSIGRGNGAPGFMSYWTLTYAVIFQFLETNDIDNGSVVLLMKWDFAIIMLSAAVYKYKTGYLKGRGIEYGLKNEMWTWAYRMFQKVPNDSPIFRILNFLSILVEFLVFLFLLLPGFHRFAAVLLALMFLFLFAFVRLGTLPITMFALSYVYFGVTDYDYKISSPVFLNLLCVSYGLLLIFSLAWNWTYFLKIETQRSLAFTLQKSYLITGSIIWSVFTARLTENLILIQEVAKGQSTAIKSIDFGVHSGISLTTIATYTDYFPEETVEQNRRFEIYLKSLYGNISNKEIFFYKSRGKGNDLEINLIKTIKFH